MNYVYITDSKYVLPTCVSIQSLIRSLKCIEDIIIYVVTVDLESEKYEELLSATAGYNVKVRIIKSESISNSSLNFQHPKYNVSATISSLCKFDLPQLLENEDVVVYLDGDTIVNGNISNLNELDLTNYYLAAVEDMGDERNSEGYSLRAGKIGLHRKLYFNSGMMILNLKKMRENNVTDKLYKYRAESINYFMDQDAFNSVLGDLVLWLPYKYNFLTLILNRMSADEISRKYSIDGQNYEEIIDNAMILHMADTYKPWKYYSRYFSHYYIQYCKNNLFRGELYNDLISPYKVIYDEKVKANSEIVVRDEVIAHKRWSFPKNLIEKNKKIVIYGAGDIGQDYIEWLNDTKYCKIVSVVDKKLCEFTNGISNPDTIKNFEFDYVLIAVWNDDDIRSIRENLIKMGVDKEKILSIK